MEFVPPRKVFKLQPRDAQKRYESIGYDIPNMLYATQTANGGMASVYQGHPFPRKGLVYSEGIIANNKAKRITLTLFQSFAGLKKGIIGFLDSYLANYTRLVDSIFADCDRVPYLHYHYYCESSKSSWNFTFLFLRHLGISFKTAYKCGLIVATMLEFDDAYRVRLQDILSESSKEQFKNPRKEINRLAAIYQQREPNLAGQGDKHHGVRLLKFVKLINTLLLLPPIKKAFLFALENVNFQWFQYDDMDLYWQLNRADYLIQGRPLEERMEQQLQFMEEYARQLNPGKEIVRETEENGRINIKLKDEMDGTAPMA